MSTAQDNEVNVPAPPQFRPEDVVIAVLQDRFRNLSKEERNDLVSLIDEVMDGCTPEEYEEIGQAMRELLFPEALGGIIRGSAGPATATEALESRMAWISKKIRDLRAEKHMTQTQLAESSGLPQSHISRLEAGQHSPSFKTIEKLAKALEVDVGQIDPAH